MDAGSASLQDNRQGRRQIALLLASTGLFALIALAAWLVVPLSLVKLAVAGVLGCVVGLLVLAYPKYGAFFGLFYVYAGLSYYTSFPVAAPVTFLVAAAVILSFLRGDSFQITDPLFGWSVAFFTLFALQSLLFAYDYSLALYSLSEFAKSLLVVFILSQLLRTERDLQELGFVIFAATLSTVILGVVNVKLGLVKNWTVLMGAFGFLRFGTTHINPNNAALYLITGLPFGIYAVKRARRAWLKVVLIACAVSMVAATIMTFSRQAIFPMSVVLLGTLFKEARSKWVYVAVAAVVLMGILLTPQYYWYRISTVSDVFSQTTEDFSLRLRMQALATGWHLFLQHPFTGVGLANFTVRSATELIVRMGAHNGYLEILTGVGIFGLITFILIFVSGIRGYVKAIKTRWPEDRRWMSDLAYYSLLSMSAILVNLFFQHVQFYRVVWVPVAAGILAGKLADKARALEKNTET